MKIGYILGLKKGIHRFIYRELLEVEKDFKIAIFPTKLNKAIYNPKENWEVFPYSRIGVLVKQSFFFLSSPHKYLKSFWTALKTNSVTDFMIAAQFSQKMKKFGVDWIHCHFGDRKFFIGYFCKQLTGLPLSVTIHAHELYRNPNWGMFKLALEGADRIVAISEFNKRELINRFGVPSDKVDVIRLFVDSKEDVVDSMKKKILMVGSFEERKGYDVLFKALKKINRNDYEVWVVGEGHLPVEEWAEGLPVKFLGTVNADTLNILYSACDLFVLPSKTARVKPVEDSNITAEGEDREGIPVVLMEAMLAGKPVISTYHAGIPELVEETIVPENSVDELAKALQSVLQNYKKYLSEAKKNHAIVLKKFSKKNVESLKKIWKKQ